MEMTEESNLFESRAGKTIRTQDDCTGTNSGGCDEKNLIMNLGNGTENESDDRENCITHQTGTSMTKNGVTY
jgi:hypothetical protein